MRRCHASRRHSVNPPTHVPCAPVKVDLYGFAEKCDVSHSRLPNGGNLAWGDLMMRSCYLAPVSLVALFLVHFVSSAQAQDATELVKDARTAYDDGDYDKTIAILNDAIALDATFAGAYSLRGRAHNEKEEFTEAVNDFDEALRLDPSLMLTRGHRAWAHYGLGDLPRCIDDCEELLRRDPQSGASYAMRAECYLDMQEFEKALDDACHAIRLGSRHAQIYAARGRAAIGVGKLNDAAADFSRAIELDQNNVQYAKWAAAAWNEVGATEQALAAAEHVCQLDPTQEPFLCQIRAQYHNRAGERDEARAEATNSIELAPGELRGYVCRAEILCSQGDYESALQDCQRIFDLSPPSSLPYQIRGHVYLGLGQHESAIADLTEALRLEPKSFTAYTYRARAYAATGKYREAIEDCLSFRRLSHQRTESMALLMANCYLETHELTKALSACNEAVRLNTDSAEALNARAWILATSDDDELRNGAAALEGAKRACELTSGGKWECLDTLAAAHAECGDFAAAVEAQQRSIDLAPEAEHGQLKARLALFRDGKPYRMK